MSEDKAYQQLHRINIALGRLCKGEIDLLQYELECKNARATPTRMAAASNDRTDETNPLLLDEVPRVVSTGGENSRPSETPVALPQVEDSDVAADESDKLEQAAKNALSNIMAG